MTWIDEEPVPCRIWKLIPVKVGGVLAPSQKSSEMLRLGSLHSYNGDTTGQSSTSHTQHAEPDRDDFGTIVTEVTIVTTRRKYRVEDA